MTLGFGRFAPGLRGGPGHESSTDPNRHVMKAAFTTPSEISALPHKQHP